MTTAATQMLTTLAQLHEALGSARLPLDLPGVDASRTRRRDLVNQLGDYVLPRLIEVDAPLLAVVGGSTGAGKSTLVNSLVGEVVTEADVLRPTTRSPVLVHHPSESEWFDQARILPDFRRTPRASADPGALQVVASERVPAGLAILDAPDVDSVERRNRELARQLLAAADMWLFVTSAARYADQVPWDYLRAAADRSAEVAVVLDRTRAAALEEVAEHLGRLLASRGLRESPVFTVPETPLDDDGLLPQEYVEDIQSWLEELAADADTRTDVVRRTLGGAIRVAARESHEVADAIGLQQQAALQLRKEVTAVHESGADQLSTGLTDGSLLRGELHARWHDFAAEADHPDGLEGMVQRARERLVRAVRRERPLANEVVDAVESALSDLVVARAEAVAEETDRAWRAGPTGRSLLDGSDLSRASAGLRDTALASARAWLEEVRAMVASPRAGSDAPAYAVADLTAALAVAALTARAAEPTAAPRILTSAFGAPEAAALVDRASTALVRRTPRLVEDEQRRWLARLDVPPPGEDHGERIRELARQVESLRLHREVVR